MGKVEYCATSAILKAFGESSNGRTSGFGPEYRGSSPCSPAILSTRPRCIESMIMYSKIFNWTKTFLGKALAILTAIVVVMTFIDFLLKWQIYPYLFSVVTAFFGVLHEFAFEVFVSVSLVVLTLFLWKLQKQFIGSKPNALEKQILDTRTHLESQIKKNSKGLSWILKSRIIEVKTK